jgi:tetratricopeptide (TPR) repeat protein
MPTIADAANQAFSAYATGDLAQAEWWDRQVLQYEPNRSDILNLLGGICHQSGDINAAIGWYREALDAEPNNAETYNNLGVALQVLGHLDTALAQFEAAIALRPDYPQAFFNLGNALMADGQISVAQAAYERALKLKPDYTSARNNLAYLFQAIDAPQQAIRLYRQSLLETPNAPRIRMNLANLLQEQGNFEGARLQYQQACELDPNNADLFYNLARLHEAQGDISKAIPTYYQALKLNPQQAESHHNLGRLLSDERPTEALAHLQQAITYQPDSEQAFNSIGKLWQQQCEIEAAIASFQQAIKLDPDFADAHVNLAQALLLQGDYQRGFTEYHWRWQSAAFLQTQLPRHRSIPSWDGSDLTNKRILLWAEQDLSTALLFIRHVPLIVAQAGAVVVECDRELMPLFQQLPGVETVIERGDRATLDSLAKSDYQASLIQIAEQLNTTVETIPKLPNWSQLIAKPSINQSPNQTPNRSLKKIGLILDARIQNATMPIEQQKQLLNNLRQIEAVSVVRLISVNGLQTQTETSPETSPDLDILIYDDFSTAASAIASLDLVITTDNPIAHLAANLGQPTWILLPFSPVWHWMLDRADSPWYPSARLFRQDSSGNWDSILRSVINAIEAM